MLDLEREGWLPVHEGEQQQGLHLAQEGVLEGVLEVLEVLEGVQEGMQGGLLEPRVPPSEGLFTGNSGVYWDYTDGIAGLWRSDFSSSDQLQYPDYSPNYQAPSGYPSYGDGNIQDIQSLYQGYYSDPLSTQTLYYDGKFGQEGIGHSSLGQTLEYEQNVENLMDNHFLGRPTSDANEDFGKPGPLIALLDMVAAALGSKPTRIGDFQERVADRRNANLTNVLHGKLPEMLVIGRASLSTVNTAKELLLRLLEWVAYILCDFFFQIFWT